MCVWKWIKRSVVGLAALSALGFFVFGKDVYSYVSSSGRIIQNSLQESVPFEFQIKRARLLLEDLVPQMHANIKLIAHEEVEIATLEKELSRENESVDGERSRIQALRASLDEQKVSYNFKGRDYSRDQVVEELGRRFEHFRTAEFLLSSKVKLLENRNRSLDAARKKLDKMRVARLELAAQIEALEGQFRLVQAESATSDMDLDDSKLSQLNSLLGDLRTRLAVAQRVLAHESRFVENIPVDTVEEQPLLESIDAHFEPVGSFEPVADSSF